MRITHSDGNNVKQHHEIKRNGVMKAKLENLLLIGETNSDEYTISDDGLGYVTDVNHPSETDFYNHEFDILIAKNDEVLEICLNTIAPYLTEWDGEFLVNAIIEIPYTIQGITIVEDSMDDDVVYDVENASVIIHGEDATILKLKPEDAGWEVM